MSFLNNIFGNTNSESEKKVDWNALTSIHQLEEIVALSFEKPVFIFKHSTRCGISRMVLKGFENEYNTDNEVVAFFLDLLAYREVSNAVAEKFNVVHQSPQLLLIKDGQSVYDVSHGDIDAASLVERL